MQAGDYAVLPTCIRDENCLINFIKKNGFKYENKDKMLGKRVYVIFPMYRKNTEDGVIVAVDEILNKGIHPENDHSSGIPLGQKYVGRKCIAILQEG